MMMFSATGAVMTEERSALPIARNFGTPVLGICGYSGSGKTTLLEAAIPQLIRRGLAIAVVKHDAHNFSIDCPGKDSDRFFRAGATVVLRSSSEEAHRRGAHSGLSLETTLADLARDHDLIFVEGHKKTDVPKLWLCDDKGALPPATVSSVLKCLPWDSERLEVLLGFLDDWLVRSWKARPVCAGLLVRGESGNGSIEGASNLCSKVAILGPGPVPSALLNVTRLADVAEVSGPLAGLLAAHRWNPRATWILAPCDHSISVSDLQALIEQRKPGVWAVMVNPDGGRRPATLGLFEPQALEILERAVLERGGGDVHIADLSDHPKTLILSR